MFWQAFSAGDASLRRIFVLVNAEDFTKLKIQRVFTGLANEYDNPKDLIITIFSDRTMLQRAIENHQSGLAIEFSKAPEVRENVRKFKERYYPLKSGYYRGYYFRSHNGGENFLYSPDPDKEELVRVTLKAPGR